MKEVSWSKSELFIKQTELDITDYFFYDQPQETVNRSKFAVWQ